MLTKIDLLPTIQISISNTDVSTKFPVLQEKGASSAQSNLEKGNGIFFNKDLLSLFIKISQGKSVNILIPQERHPDSIGIPLGRSGIALGLPQSVVVEETPKMSHEVFSEKQKVFIPPQIDSLKVVNEKPEVRPIVLSEKLNVSKIKNENAPPVLINTHHNNSLDAKQMAVPVLYSHPKGYYAEYSGVFLGARNSYKRFTGDVLSLFKQHPGSFVEAEKKDILKIMAKCLVGMIVAIVIVVILFQ